MRDIEANRHDLIKGNAVLTAIAGSITLAIGLGVGRFAFTGLYPLMVEDGILSVKSGALVASFNYAGYLLGAMLAVWVKPESARAYSIWSVVMTITCMVLLAFMDSSWAVIIVRGFAGIFSALAMVGASLWLLQYMGHPHQAPLLYAGVGIGITISAEFIAVGSYLGLSSNLIWSSLALICLVSLFVISPALLDSIPRIHDKTSAKTASAQPSNASAVEVVLLVSVYGLAGFGYIITATYLPLVIKGSLESVDPLQVWAVFGLGAVPSCYVWHALHMRLGTRCSLALNLLVQSSGVVIPAFGPTASSSLVGAVLVGGTFMGTVTIAMSAARRIDHKVRFNLLAVMTAAYGTGQIIGPLIANEIYSTNQSFKWALIAAAFALLVASTLSRWIQS